MRMNLNRSVKTSILMLFSTMLFLLSAGKAIAVTPQCGWWWNPAEGGRGFTLEVQNGTMFMAGYLYDPSGRATWYAAGPTAMNGSTFSSQLTTYLGGQTLTGNYRPTTGTLSNGNITMNFSDPSHGTLTWAGGTISIQRYDIVLGGANAPNPAGSPETGWWWNPAEGGRGFSLEIQKNTMFMAGYMYDDAGNPTWFASGPTAMNSPNTYKGTWQEYGNGQTLTGAFKPASVINANVGNVTITFSSSTAGTIVLPNGKLIPVTRYSFGGSSSVQAYAGTYSGTYSGYDTGAFNVTISSTGAIVGIGHSNTDNVNFGVSGTTGANGNISMTTNGQAGTAIFSGSISPTGGVTGNWHFSLAPTSGGLFSGQKQ